MATTWLGLRPPWTIVKASANGAALVVAFALLARLALRPGRLPTRVPEAPWMVAPASGEENPTPERRVRCA